MVWASAAARSSDSLPRTLVEFPDPTWTSLVERPTADAESRAWYMADRHTAGNEGAADVGITASCLIAA